MNDQRRALAVVVIQVVFLMCATSALDVFVSAESPERMLVAVALVMFWGFAMVALYAVTTGMRMGSDAAYKMLLATALPVGACSALVLLLNSPGWPELLAHSVMALSLLAPVAYYAKLLGGSHGFFAVEVAVASGLFSLAATSEAVRVGSPLLPVGLVLACTLLFALLLFRRGLGGAGDK